MLDMQVSVRVEQLQFSPCQPASHWQNPQLHFPWSESIEKTSESDGAIVDHTEQNTLLRNCKTNMFLKRLLPAEASALAVAGVDYVM